MTGTLHLGSFTAISAAITGTATRTFGERATDVVNVKDFGAKGDGTTDDTMNIQAALNAAYGTPGAPHGAANKHLNRAVFFPNGNYRVSAPLTLRSVRGGWIFGAGRESTRIFQSTANTSVFVTNGFDYSRVEGLSLAANGTGVAFDMDWDGIAGSAANQANTFAQCAFGGSLNTTGVGLRIGVTGGNSMGSETLIMNCHFGVIGRGLQTCNGNALQNTVIGGNFQDCNIGISVSSGNVPLIMSVGFQASGTFDIQVDGVGTIQDGMTVVNCRSESLHFLKNRMGVALTLIGNGQTHSSAGTFVDFIGPLTMLGNSSINGTITCPAGNGGHVTGSGNFWGTAASPIAIPWASMNQANVNVALMSGFDSHYWNTNSVGALASATFSRLPAASAMTMGTVVPVSDSTTATVDATITGGGANKVLAFSTNSAWKVLKAL